MKEGRRKNKIVLVDPRVINEVREREFGRNLSPLEKRVLDEADSIRVDALACGRSIKTTVYNIERYGGKVSPAVKAVLGLIPSVN